MDKIARSLKRIVKPTEFTISRAMVVGVNGRTCRVEYDSTGFERDNVLLSLCPEDNSVLLIPKLYSDVYVANAEGYDAFIVGYGEVDKVSIKVGGIPLGETLSELLDTLRYATVNTPSGVGTIGPDTQKKLEDTKEKLNTIFP